MLKNVIGKLLGSANDRIIKSYDKTVSLINDLEPKYHTMSDDELRAQTVALRGFSQSLVRALTHGKRRIRHSTPCGASFLLGLHARLRVLLQPG